MSVKNIRNFLVVLALMSVSVLVGYRVGTKQLSTGTLVTTKEVVNTALINEVKSRLETQYLDKSKINDSKMSYGAIEGMVASLGDPYTVFLPPDENKSSQQDLSGSFGGVGISLGYKDSTLAVMSTLAKSPALAAGLKAGDLILKITDKAKNLDKDTTGIALDEAVNLIRGTVGSEVTLKMYRASSSETFNVTLKRAIIDVPNLEITWKKENGKNVAWIGLHKFTEQLYSQWPDIVKQVVAKKNEGNFGGIVLDLRDNPGGYLEAAVLVASDFIQDGVVVSQESANGQIQKYNVDKSRNQLVSDPTVVLINGGSASAAEILAGALKDYNRAKLMGEKSFGKGTVQQPEDLSDGSGLHVTVAKWLLPSGKNIHGVGVEPDVSVKWATDSADESQYKDVYSTLLGGTK